MSVLIRVFIPETGTKTQLLHDDIQKTREWAIKHSDPSHTVQIYKKKDTQIQTKFLKEMIVVFGVWKNVQIH
jgi:hypothetical protein